MSTIQKLIEKFYRKPIPSDITYDELKRIASHFGCVIVDSGRNNRHSLHINHPSVSYGIPVPVHGKCVKEIYIKKIKELIDSIKEVRHEV